jgi:hypothetical protein
MFHKRSIGLGVSCLLTLSALFAQTPASKAAGASGTTAPQAPAGKAAGASGSTVPQTPAGGAAGAPGTTTSQTPPAPSVAPAVQPAPGQLQLATDGQVLNLHDDSKTGVVLRNDDAQPYTVTCTVLVDGRQVGQGTGKLPAKGTGTCDLAVDLPFDWWRPFWLIARLIGKGQEILKPQQPFDVQLHLAFDGSAATQDIATKATIGSIEPLMRSTLKGLILVGLLTLGGLASLLMNNFLPNRLRRINLKERLEALAVSTANLSSHLDSRLGVVARLHRSSLEAKLKSRNTISPDFASIATQCEASADRLDTRVDLLQQIDSIITQMASANQQMPPSQADQMEDSLEKASEFLGKSDPSDNDLQAAQTAVNQAAGRLGNMSSGAEFGLDLAKRVKALKDELAAGFAARPTFTRVMTIVKEPHATVQAVNADATIDPANYVSVDLAVVKMRLLKDYVALRDGVTDEEIGARMDAHEQRLLQPLQLETRMALQAARLAFREMQSDIYTARLRQAVVANPPEVFIAVDPPVAYENQPLQFEARFAVSDLNQAAARAEWNCRWTFGDGLGADGWNPSHYYANLLKYPPESPDAASASKKAGRKWPFFAPKPKHKFTVSVTFTDENGQTIPTVVPIVREIQVTRSGDGGSLRYERSITEGVRLIAVLAIAVVGLIVGAKDQLARLDVLPGLIAIFMLGFSADSVKNILGSK